MSTVDFIVERPLILAGVIWVILGVIFLKIGASSLQTMLVSIFVIVLIIIVAFSFGVTIMSYRRNNRPLDWYAVSMFWSAFFICLSPILMFFVIVVPSTQSALNAISFPVAIFAFGVALYYFFDAQFSTDKKLDEIDKKLVELLKQKQ